VVLVSQLAASVMYEALRASKVEYGNCLRLVKRKTQFVLLLDKPSRTDRVIRYKESIVLIIDERLEIELGNARIDVEEMIEGRNLVMRRSRNTKDTFTVLTHKVRIQSKKNKKI